MTKEGSFNGGGEKPVETVEVVEAAEVQTKKLKEGVSKGWEGERRFTEREVLESFKALGYDMKGTEVVLRLIDHDGALISVEFKAPGAVKSYQYLLKGIHGPRNTNDASNLMVNDWSGPDESDYVDNSNKVAVHIDGAWKKL